MRDIGQSVKFPESPHISTFHDGHATRHVPTYGLGRNPHYPHVGSPHTPTHEFMPHAVEHHLTVTPVDAHHEVPKESLHTAAHEVHGHYWHPEPVVH